MSTGDERDTATRRERLGEIARKLGPYARPHRRGLVTALAASAAVTVAQLAMPLPLSWIVALSTTTGSAGLPAWLPRATDPFLWPTIALVVVGTALGGSEYVQRLAVARFVINTVNDARVQIVAEVTSPAATSTGRRDPGDVVNRIVGETARLRGGLKGAFVHLLQHGLFLVGVAAVLLALDPWLGLTYLGGLVVALGVAAGAAERTALLSLDRREREARLVARVLLASRTTGAQLASKPTDRDRSTAFISQVKGRAAWVVQGLLAVTACLVLLLAVHFTEIGRLGIGDLALVASYLLMLHYPMTRMGRQITRLGPQLTSAERLARLASAGAPRVAR